MAKAATTANAKKSQPIGLCGLREATSIPTTANDTAIKAHNRKELASDDRRIKPAARMSSASAKDDQASQAAAREPIPSTPRPGRSSLAASVTKPLYNTTVSQALRRPLR